VAEANALRFFRLCLVPNVTLIEFRFLESVDKSVEARSQDCLIHISVAVCASGENSLSRGIELPSVEYQKKAPPPTVRCDIGTTNGMDFNLDCEVRNSGQILRELRSDITIVYQVK